MRILAVDPGEKRFGVAISDPTETVASPAGVIKHVSRDIDAATIAQIAGQNQVGMIVIGKSLDEDGNPTPASRRADRFAQAIRLQINTPVVFWDESFTTQEARKAQIEMGTARHKRQGHLDEMAAVIILQSFLEARSHH